MGRKRKEPGIESIVWLNRAGDARLRFPYDGNRVAISETVALDASQLIVPLAHVEPIEGTDRLLMVPGLFVIPWCLAHFAGAEALLSTGTPATSWTPSQLDRAVERVVAVPWASPMLGGAVARWTLNHYVERARRRSRPGLEGSRRAVTAHANAAAEAAILQPLLLYDQWCAGALRNGCAALNLPVPGSEDEFAAAMLGGGGLRRLRGRGRPRGDAAADRIMAYSVRRALVASGVPKGKATATIAGVSRLCGGKNETFVRQALEAVEKVLVTGGLPAEPRLRARLVGLVPFLPVTMLFPADWLTDVHPEEVYQRLKDWVDGPSFAAKLRVCRGDS